MNCSVDILSSGRTRQRRKERQARRPPHEERVEKSRERREQEDVNRAALYLSFVSFHKDAHV